MKDKYNNLPPEELISLGIMFMLSGVTLPKPIASFFKENDLYGYIQSGDRVHERDTANNTTNATNNT